MKISRLAGIATLLAAGFAQAQAVKFDGALIEFWYSQMMDNNLRLSTSAVPAGSSNYYGVNALFAENTFAIKRSEVYLSGKVSDNVSWNLMFDPNNSTSSVGNNVLHDAVITWTVAKGLTLKAGQFKMPTTYEATIVSARDILFWDRNQLNRAFGDKRDRGVWAQYAFGSASYQGKFNLAVSNGTTDDGSGGKNNDANAQKDWTFRYDGAVGTAHKFGAYYREGATNLKDSTMVSATIPATWTVGVPTTTAFATQIKDNKDKTTLQGLYYAYNAGNIYADFEYATGLLGRRYPTVFAAASAPKREHLDQKFAGYVGTVVYKMGAHWLLARYDVLNYNSSSNWYTAYNPYTQSAANTPLLVNGAPVDYSPKYTETTLGYNYLFNPGKYTTGKLKLDYIMRSKNFLAPRAGQVGEQGGDSFVASLMIGF